MPPSPNAPSSTPRTGSPPTEKRALNEHQQEALRRTLLYALGGGVAGAGVRSAVGLGEMLFAPPPPRPYQPEPTVVEIPYRVKKDRPARRPAAGVQPRSLGLGEFKAAGFEEQVGSTVRDILNYLAGADAKRHDQVPWYMASLALGIPAGFYGGYRLIDSRLKGQRAADSKDELEEAKKRYLAANQAQFGTAKAAAEKVLFGESPLDRLAERYEQGTHKQADGWWTDLANAITPWYLAAAVPAALGSGALAYNYTRATDPELERAQAVRKQIEQANLARTPSLYASLVPVDEQGRRIDPRAAKKMRQEVEAPKEAADDAGGGIEERARRFVAGLLKKAEGPGRPASVR